jgi:hypothetical protein
VVVIGKGCSTERPMGKVAEGTSHPNLRSTSRRRDTSLSRIASMPSAFHASNTSTDVTVEIEKWLTLVDSYWQQVPRRNKA